MLLWLWHRLAATALIRSLAWEPPYAASVALKRQKINQSGNCVISILRFSLYSGSVSNSHLSSHNHLLSIGDVFSLASWFLWLVQSMRIWRGVTSVNLYLIHMTSVSLYCVYLNVALFNVFFFPHYKIMLGISAL